MKLNQIILVLFAITFSATAAIADCWCTHEWLWGGCANWECGSTLSSSDGGSSGASYDKIELKNKCSRPILAAIRYQTTAGEWTTQGWYSLNPGETQYVAATKNRNFYTYAESKDSNTHTRLTWKGTDKWYQVKNSSSSYGFKHQYIPDSSWGVRTYSFSCPGQSRYKAMALAWTPNGGWAVRIRNSIPGAKGHAMKDCSDSNNNCSIGTTINTNGPGCIALAKSGNRLFYATRTTRDKAEPNAMASCFKEESDCTLAYSGCNQ